VSAAIAPGGAPSGPWLFGRELDLLAFGGSAVLSLLLLAVGLSLGWHDTPDGAWIALVLAVDVAHVWSTIFRFHLDPAELRRRPFLAFGVPLLAWGGGVLLHAFGSGVFWRVLAYLAAFHFVRQQYGWIRLYHRKPGEGDPVDRWIDTAAIYAATVHPLLWWHGHLPRRFHWFLEGDFVALPAALASATEPLYWAILAAFGLRQAWRASRRRPPNPGKVLVVSTTAVLWFVGIRAFDGDFAFTVTNVVAHGLPYFVLTYLWGARRAAEAPTSPVGRILRFGVPAFMGVVVALAFCEEMLWDRYVWHDRAWLFGDGGELGRTALSLLVPLLAVPQVTHYVLDGFIWRRRATAP
jgi:hypothetical protein